MANEIRDLIDRLIPDQWRAEAGFSPDIEAAHSQLFGKELSAAHAADVLNRWLAENQPCLFGRIGARLGLITYCVLTEFELGQPDSVIRDKIQAERLRWLRSGLTGGTSAFVILALSQRISVATPDATLEALARRLCFHYLLRDIETDRIYLDALELELPGKDGSRWRWDVGVNYFSAQGDKRWWHDHRIPGGMAFSMNSVGHLVKSGRFAGAMRVFERTMQTPTEGWRHPSIDSLEKALTYAMRTIDGAAETSSGRATQLLPLDEDPISKCPFELPSDLRGKNFCEYIGYYHTDVTVPSEYFRPEVKRPPDIRAQRLDFTYLFDEQLDNPDHLNMGEGRQVRDEDFESSHADLSITDRILKRGRAKGRPVIESQ